MTAIENLNPPVWVARSPSPWSGSATHVESHNLVDSRTFRMARAVPTGLIDYSSCEAGSELDSLSNKSVSWLFIV